MSKKREVRGPRHKVRLDAEKLDALRKDKGWTIEDLATAADVSDSTIKRALRKSGGEVSALSADQITYALEIALDKVALKERISRRSEIDSEALRRGFHDTVPNTSDFFFSKDDIHTRYVDIREMAELFTDQYTQRSSLEFEISPVFLYEAVQSAYDDIMKTKTYHLDESPVFEDRYKAASIVSCAISRCRPIWIRSASGKEDIEFQELAKEALLVNDLFAANVGFAYAKIDSSELDSEQIYDIVYHLKYHSDVNGLMLIYKNLANSLRNDNNVF